MANYMAFESMDGNAVWGAYASDLALLSPPERSRDQTFRPRNSALSDFAEDFSFVKLVDVSADGHPETAEAVIKYRSNCGFVGEKNLLIKNHIFMRLLSAEGISPQSFVISAPAVVKASDVYTRGVLPSIQECIGASVHFSVMERFGDSIRNLIRGSAQVFDLKKALNVAIKVIRLLKELHTLGVLHGDIDWSNVVMDGEEVKLIDFDRAVLVGRRERTESVQGKPKTRRHWLLPDLAGTAQRTYFGDIYGVYEMIGAMTRGDALYEKFQRHDSDLLRYKTDKKFIEVTAGFFQRQKGIENRRIIDAIHNAFHTQALRGNRMPDHDLLMERINELIGFLERNEN